MPRRTGPRRSRRAPLLAALCAGLVSLLATPVVAQSDAWSRADLVRAALDDPAFDAFEIREAAAYLRAEAARERRHPLRLDVQVAALPIETRQGSQLWSVGAAQQLTNRRQTAASGTAFEADGRAAIERRDAAMVDRAWRIDQALLAIERAEAHIALYQERRALLDAQHDWVAGVLPHGAGDAAVLPRIALRTAVIDDRQLALREQIASHHAVLRELTGLDVHEVADGSWSDPVGDEFDVHVMPSPLGQDPTERALLARAQAAEARAQAAELSERVTPTLSLRWSGIIAYDLPGAEPGRDALMLGIALPIPTSARARDAEAEAARHDAIAAREQALAHGIHHDAEWHACEVRWQDAIARLSRANDELLPLARDVVHALEPTLAVDAASFDRWLLAFVEELDVAALAIDARYDAALERARARMLASIELDTLRAWREEVAQ